MKTKEEILLPVLGNIHPSNYSALLDAMEEYAKAYHEDKPTQSTATRYFNVSYVFNKNGLGYGNINITATGDNNPYLERSKVLEIISESNGASVSSIVILNTMEMNESDYKQWIR